jgi:hypothetical protein
MADSAASPGILASLGNWLSGEESKIKSALPAFEATVVKDFESAKAAVAAYGGPFAAELVDVFALVNPAEIQSFATTLLPVLEAKIVAALASVNVTGTAATAIASAAASALMHSIVAATTAAIAIPK